MLTCQRLSSGLRKQMSGSTPDPLSWRTEIDFTNNVTQTVTALFANRDLFTALGGAVFALQQDLKRAANINLWDKTNILHQLVDQHLKMPKSIGQSARVDEAVNDLNSILEMNLTFLENYQTTYKHNPPAHLTAADLEAYAFQGGLRCRAAQVWLLTVKPPSPTGQDMVQLAATNVWLRLGAIGANDLVEMANELSGTFYNEVKCTSFELSDWPALSH